MPDHYGVKIRIWPWREDDPGLCEVSARLIHEFGPIQPEDGNEALGPPIVSPLGVLSVTVEEASEGIEEYLEAGRDLLEEPSLVGLLQRAGLSFEIYDERGEGGREIAWRPGLEEVRERPLVAYGVPALSRDHAEEFMRVEQGGRLRRRLRSYLGEPLRALIRNYFAPIARYESETDDLERQATEAVVCEGDSGAPVVLYASPGADVLVVPPFREDEDDVYGPQDVLNVVAEIEALRGFASSEELGTLVLELRKTARAYAGEA